MLSQSSEECHSNRDKSDLIKISARDVSGLMSFEKLVISGFKRNNMALHIMFGFYYFDNFTSLHSEYY